MNKPTLTLVLLLGALCFAKAQSIPTNSGGSITITNMGGFNGTYVYWTNATSGGHVLAAGYPHGSIAHFFRDPSTLGIVAFVTSGGTKLLRLRNPKNGIEHNVVFDINGNIMTNSGYLTGDGLKIQNGTLNNYMATWDGGGTGPGYEAMLSQTALNEAALNAARQKAENLTEGLTFENGQWSPK